MQHFLAISCTFWCVVIQYITDNLYKSSDLIPVDFEFNIRLKPFIKLYFS